MARALREQIDWAKVRSRANDTPFARAFFVMVEGLGIAPDLPAPNPGGDDDQRVRVDVTTA
jgi:hypothetical protein